MVERAFLGDPAAQDELTHEEWDLPGGSMLPPLRSEFPDEGFVSQEAPSAPDLSSAQHAPQASAAAEPEPAASPALPAELARFSPDLSEALPLLYPETPDQQLAGSEGSSEDEDRTLLLTDEDVERIARRVRVPPPLPRPVDLDDPITLERLALNLYGHVRGMLRSELLVDRERSGVLTEFHQE